MKNQTWDKYVLAHPKGYCVGTAMQWKKPSQLSLCKDGRNFPTPRRVIEEMVTQITQSEWAIRSNTQRQFTIINMAFCDKDDAEKVIRAFKAFLKPKSEPQIPCIEQYQFHFEPSDYMRIAKALGYEPRG